MDKFSIELTQIFTIYVKKVDLFFRAFGGSLGSVLDSHAAGPGSIPDCASVVKVMRVCLSAE